MLGGRFCSFVRQLSVDVSFPPSLWVWVLRPSVFVLAGLLALLLWFVLQIFASSLHLRLRFV